MSLPEWKKTKTISIHLPGYPCMINFTSNTLTTPSVLHDKSPTRQFPSKHLQKMVHIFTNADSLFYMWVGERIFTGILKVKNSSLG